MPLLRWSQCCHWNALLSSSTSHSMPGSLTFRQHLSWSGLSFGDLTQTFVISESEPSFASQNMIVMTVHLQLLPGIKIPKHRAMIISTLILVLCMCQKEYMCIREKWKASEKDKCIILCNAHHHQATATNNSNDKNKIAILKWRKPKISNCETQWSTKIKYTYVHIIV